MNNDKDLKKDVDWRNDEYAEYEYEEECEQYAEQIVKITTMIDWTKVTDNEEVIRLIKEREKIEEQIRAIDEMALVRYELEALQE